VDLTKREALEGCWLLCFSRLESRVCEVCLPTEWLFFFLSRTSLVIYYLSPCFLNSHKSAEEKRISGGVELLSIASK
jgi:TRAP-type mannitol/chloroaromatic compound transport system permease small subunit